jgi:hypothetical protein
MAATENPAGQTINITFYVAKVASNNENAPINSDPNPFYGQTATFLVNLNTTFSYYCLYFGFNLTVPDNTRAGIFITVDSSFLWGTTATCDGGEVDGYPLPGISIADTFQTRFQNQTEVSSIAAAAGSHAGPTGLLGYWCSSQNQLVFQSESTVPPGRADLILRVRM